VRHGADFFADGFGYRHTGNFNAKARGRKGKISACAVNQISVLSGKSNERKLMPDNQTPNQTPTPPPATGGEDKTVAIVAYLTLIGFFVALIIHMNKKTKLGAYHLRQMLGFVLTGIAIVFCEFILIFIPILGWLCILALWIGMFVLWILGLVTAINGQMKPMPVVGPLYQQWFGTAFD
jgi:uncharacterized membrane protein